jgi:hypothetical protein
MLAGSVDVAETTLQRVGIEKSTATRCLKCDPGHALRYLGDIAGGGARLGLLLGWRHLPGSRLIPDARHDLPGQGTRSAKLQLGLPECGLEVWVRR